MKNTVPLSLHVPAPACRPGDKTDFGKLQDLAAPGEAPRPAVDAPAKDTHPLAFSLIRVLDDKGKAVGPWDPKVDPETLKRGLKAMILTRTFDERMYRAQRQGKTSFYMKCTGEEAIACAQSLVLHREDMRFPDSIVSRACSSLRRLSGLARTTMNQGIYSNAADLDQRPPAADSCIRRSEFASFFTISGNLATQFPQAVGWAMASAYKGDDRIAAGWIGDGATAEGDFHNALTFAAVYRAPVLLNLVNNQWAISSFAGIAGVAISTTFASKGVAYGLADPARGRQRLPGGARRDPVGGGPRAFEPGRHGDRVLHLSRGPALDFRRSQSLPPLPTRATTGRSAIRLPSVSRNTLTALGQLERRGARWPRKKATTEKCARRARSPRPSARWANRVRRPRKCSSTCSRNPDWRIRRQRQEVGV